MPISTGLSPLLGGLPWPNVRGLTNVCARWAVRGGAGTQERLRIFDLLDLDVPVFPAAYLRVRLSREHHWNTREHDPYHWP